jgi:hypothetical protein
LCRTKKNNSKSKLPVAIQNSYQKEYPNAKIKRAAEEKENDITYYEVESVDYNIYI